MSTSRQRPKRRQNDEDRAGRKQTPSTLFLRSRASGKGEFGRVGGENRKPSGMQSRGVELEAADRPALTVAFAKSVPTTMILDQRRRTEATMRSALGVAGKGSRRRKSSGLAVRRGFAPASSRSAAADLLQKVLATPLRSSMSQLPELSAPPRPSASAVGATVAACALARSSAPIGCAWEAHLARSGEAFSGREGEAARLVWYSPPTSPPCRNVARRAHSQRWRPPCAALADVGETHDFDRVRQARCRGREDRVLLAPDDQHGRARLFDHTAVVERLPSFGQRRGCDGRERLARLRAA